MRIKLIIILFLLVLGGFFSFRFFRQKTGRRAETFLITGANQGYFQIRANKARLTKDEEVEITVELAASKDQKYDAAIAIVQWQPADFTFVKAEGKLSSSFNSDFPGGQNQGLRVMAHFSRAGYPPMFNSLEAPADFAVLTLKANVDNPASTINLPQTSLALHFIDQTSDTNSVDQSLADQSKQTISFYEPVSPSPSPISCSAEGYQWVLGSAGQSCDAACGTFSGGSCAGGESGTWNDTDCSIMQNHNTQNYTTCLSCSIANAPTPGRGADCYYTGGSSRSCSAVVPDFQPLCACYSTLCPAPSPSASPSPSPSPVEVSPSPSPSPSPISCSAEGYQWVLGNAGDSCDTVCGGLSGGSCVGGESGTWNDDSNCSIMKTFASCSGDGVNPGCNYRGSSTAPNMETGGAFCYSRRSDGVSCGQKPEVSSNQRLCACYSTLCPAPSPSPSASPSPSPVEVSPSPSPTTCFCEQYGNGDRICSLADITMILESWGSTSLAQLMGVLQNWGVCP